MKYSLILCLLLLLFAFRKPITNLDNLPINKIQIIGSHNSYKRAIAPALFRLIQSRDSVVASTIDYEHIALDKQLDMGLENLEIDVYADEKGGKYAHPKGLDFVKDQPPYDPDGKMNAPGFKVFHIVDIDFRSHALTLRDCLAQLRTWSEAHPAHKPIFVTLEVKDEPTGNNELTIPEKFTDHTFNQLDSALISGLGKQHILMPNAVKGKYKTLNEAVQHGNWPTVKQASGKFLFILDDKAGKRQLYISGHPSLAGRVMFVNATPGTPEAATLILNDPKNPEIKELVKQGYIIRTRADADTRQARTNDRSGFEAACNSGAQIITTDYYLKSTHFKSDYQISFEDGTYLRANPVFATP